MAMDPKPRPRTVVNVATEERIASAGAGAALICRAFARPSLGRLLLAVGGVVLLRRGITGHSRLYEARGRGATVRLGRRSRAPDPVALASKDSFPAGDPPSWNPVVGSGARH